MNKKSQAVLGFIGLKNATTRAKRTGEVIGENRSLSCRTRLGIYRFTLC
jgi:hypothetical protein